jgi:hypothetical protein
MNARVAARESDLFCPSHPGAMQRKSLTAYLNIACENALRTHSATPSTQRIGYDEVTLCLNAASLEPCLRLLFCRGNIPNGLKWQRLRSQIRSVVYN